MKLKNKGKIFPSPSSATAGGSGSSDFLSVLNLLPAAILALASILSLPDREVLAYMVTMSLKSTPPSSIATSKKSSRKPSNNGGGGGGGGGGGSGSSSSSNNNNSSTSSPHKAPVFGCDCFDCYTSYWFRWDSSPNRELIHQVIEAFEEHLLAAEQPKKNKRRDKTTRRIATSDIASGSKLNQLLPPPPPSARPTDESASPAETEVATTEPELRVEEEERAVVLRLPPAAEGSGAGHKGIGRKVLPDVFGLLNSRLWSLWGPNI